MWVGMTWLSGREVNPQRCKALLAVGIRLGSKKPSTQMYVDPRPK